MAIEVSYTDEFGTWFASLSEAEQDRVAVSVGLLEEYGVTLPFPHSSKIEGVSFALRELRTQVKGDPLRTFYAFDASRQASERVPRRDGAKEAQEEEVSRS